MTIEQSAELLRKLFTAYPHLDTYVNSLPDPQGTIDAWRGMVAKLSHTHATEAIRRLIAGEADPPIKPWDVATLPLWIRGVAGRVADDAAKFAKAESARAAKQQASPHTARAVAAFRVSRRIAEAAAGCRVRGEITQNRNDQIIEAVKSFAKRQPEDAPEVPDDIRHEYDHPRGFHWVPGTPPLQKSIRDFH